jgi:hypothetical protein
MQFNVINRVSAMFSFLVEMEKVERNPVGKLTKDGISESKTPRQPFSNEDLEKIFCSEEYNRDKLSASNYCSRSWDYTADTGSTNLFSSGAVM